MPQFYWRENLKILRKKLGKSQEYVGLQLKTTQQTIANWEKGIGSANLEELMELTKIFGVLLDDFLNKDLKNVHLIKKEGAINTGDNVHLNVHPSVHLKGKKDNKTTISESSSLQRMPQVITMDSEGNENVIMVPVKARAGYLNGYADTEFISKLPAYRLPGLNTGTFRLFEVEGLSMHPTLHGGDLVIGSFVENLMSMRDDRVYVVVTKNDGVVVKRCLNRIEKDGKLILKSDNYKDRDFYPTIICNQEDVVEVWYATGFISRQLRPPAEMYTRLIDLEAKYTLLDDSFKKMQRK